jgi:hypothetical protein
MQVQGNQKVYTSLWQVRSEHGHKQGSCSLTLSTTAHVLQCKLHGHPPPPPQGSHFHIQDVQVFSGLHAYDQDRWSTGMVQGQWHELYTHCPKLSGQIRNVSRAKPVCLNLWFYIVPPQNSILMLASFPHVLEVRLCCAAKLRGTCNGACAASNVIPQGCNAAGLASDNQAS